MKGSEGAARGPDADEGADPGVSTWFWDDMDVRWASTNGQTSAVLLGNGTVYAVLTVTASTEEIDHVLSMVNPEKLTAVPVPA